MLCGRCNITDDVKYSTLNFFLSIWVAGGNHHSLPPNTILNVSFEFTWNGISLITIVGESTSVSKEMTAPWNETTLPTLLSNYKLEDIYNADEFGLFYQCLPGKTNHLSGEKCSGGKSSKIRFNWDGCGKFVRRKASYVCNWEIENTSMFKIC